MLHSRPEALGVVSGCMLLIALFFFIPIPFSGSLFNGQFPHDEVFQIITILLDFTTIIA